MWIKQGTSPSFCRQSVSQSSKGSEGQIAAALKRYNGGRVLVFVVGAFAEMSEDVSRICGIIAYDLARTHVSYYNNDA